ncbi:MAG TPA: glycosyltransferase [Planctomycetia bacterium]|nr:glycosyltransferase [Planctomycetia bacterium]
MPPRAIALGITDLDVGGAERNFVELVLRLDRAKWTPSVTCLQPVGGGAGALAGRLRSADVPVSSLEMKSVRDLWRGFRQWKAELTARRPALLQTFLQHANALGRYAGRSAGVPKIVAGVRVAEKRSWWRTIPDRIAAGGIDAHVCVSRAVADFQIKRARLDPAKVFVIPNGIDIAATAATKPVDRGRTTGDEPRRLAVVAVGRLDPQKGLDRLIEALAELPAEIRRERQITVNLVGKGPEEATLRALARVRGVEDLVTFHGWQAEPLAWIAAADVLALPSRWEGMPNVLLEAMALGKPAIATDVEGVRELLGTGADRCGVIVPAGSGGEEKRVARDLAKSLAEFMAAWRRSEGRSALDGFDPEKAKRRARELFSYERMTAAYEEVWEKTLVGK